MKAQSAEWVISLVSLWRTIGSEHRCNRRKNVKTSRGTSTITNHRLNLAVNFAFRRLRPKDLESCFGKTLSLDVTHKDWRDLVFELKVFVLCFIAAA